MKWTGRNKAAYLLDPDNQLVLKTGSGDMGAFRILMEKYQMSVMRLIYRYTGNHPDAEDLAQDIFLKIYRAAATYKPRALFKTWLYKIVTNHCLNFQRNQKKHKSDIGLDPSRAVANSPRGPDYHSISEPVAEHNLEREELQATIRKAIAGLPERQRMAVILFRFEELSYEEIAQALGCSRSAVESLIFRAMNQLKEILKPRAASSHAHNS